MYRFLPLLLIVTLAVPAGADILWFKNGRKLEGKVQELSDGRVEIAMSFGTLAFEADRIDRIEKARTLEEIVQAALASISPEEADELLELASWCRDHDADTLANRVLETLISVDPDNAQARQSLGYVQVGDRWLSEGDARRARGEVFYQGEWLSAEELERLRLRQELERLQRRSERFEEASLELELARLELETERVSRESGSGDGIPLSWVWAPSSGPLPPHSPRRPPHHQRADRNKASQTQTRSTAPRDTSMRAPAGRQSTGTLKLPRQ